MSAVFQDPDFGSDMVRVTDAGIEPSSPGRSRRKVPVGGQNTRAFDDSRFYVAQGALRKLSGLDPSPMPVNRLPNTPLRSEPQFSLADPDVMRELSSPSPYIAPSDRCSTAVVALVFDTTTSGMQPGLSPAGDGGTISVSAPHRRLG